MNRQCLKNSNNLGENLKFKIPAFDKDRNYNYHIFYIYNCLIRFD
jgi:hypothetical protein